MPKTTNTSSSQPLPESKPYIRGNLTTPLPAQRSTSSSPSKGKPQPWTLEDKQALLAAVLATAKPDWNSISKEVFAGKGRNANQVCCQWRQVILKNLEKSGTL